MSIKYVGEDGQRRKRWKVDVTERSPSGRLIRHRRTEIFGTEAQAKRHEAQIRTMIISGGYEAEAARLQEEKKDLTVAVFVDRFLRHCRAELAESTASGRDRQLRSHILPAIGHLRLREVDTSHLEELKHDLLDKGLANGTVNTTLDTAGALFGYAHYLRLIDYVPRVRRLPYQPPPIEWLRHEQLDALLEAADGEMHDLMLIAARTGLRRGELRSLHWSSVDFVTGQILVRHNAWRDRLKQIPKGKRHRYVPLSADAVEALKRQKARTFMRSELVFAHTGGEMIPDVPFGACLEFACRKAGTRTFGWHVFRHTFGAHATMAGVFPRTLQRWMGHSSLRITERYAHVAPEQDKNIAWLDDLARQYRGNAAGGVG